MKIDVIHVSEQIYTYLLFLYPYSYRVEFGEEMTFVFSESLKEALSERGVRGVVSVWMRTCTDTITSLIIQHAENQEGVSMQTTRNDILMSNKVFLWIGAITSAILMIPLIAMQFSEDVQWGPFDFIVMGVLLVSMGSLFVFSARKITKPNHRLVVAVMFLLTLVYIWAELAVGIFTNLGS